jgi:hypothetical protein
MRRMTILVLLVAALAYPAWTLAGPNGSDDATACVFTTQLRSANETPPNTSPAFGHTQIKILNDGTIEWKTHIVNPAEESFFAGHIHLGPTGVAGPIVQPLFSGPPTSDREIEQTGSASNPALATAICTNPSAYYVNYHTTDHPAGAIRGQLG